VEKIRQGWYILHTSYIPKSRWWSIDRYTSLVSFLVKALYQATLNTLLQLNGYAHPKLFLVKNQIQIQNNYSSPCTLLIITSTTFSERSAPNNLTTKTHLETTNKPNRLSPHLSNAKNHEFSFLSDQAFQTDPPQHHPRLQPNFRHVFQI
jgi:hypothetical protein